jgi:hypothetical protein
MPDHHHMIVPIDFMGPKGIRNGLVELLIKREQHEA